MFATIRRHQKWLFALISVVVIVAFVIFFSPEIGSQGGQGREDFGTVYGEPIKREQFLNAQREAMLLYRLNYGSWPTDALARQLGFDLEQETYRRLVLVAKLNQLDVRVGDDLVIKYIQTLFRGPSGQYEPDAYQNFVSELTASGYGFTENDFHRFLRHELGIRHLVSVFGATGDLVTERQAEVAFRRENEQVVTEAVFLNATNFVSQVVVKPEELAQFFTNRMATYRIPAKVQVNYVAFEAVNFLTEAAKKLAEETNLDAQIDQVYQSRGTNSFTDAEGKPLSAEAAKEKIKSEMRQEIALVEARKKANAFASELFDMEPASAANLARLAAQKGLVVKETEPFTQSDGPKDLNVPPTFSRAAFTVTDEEPYASPIVGQDAVYVIAVKNRIPSEVPPMESVKDRLTEDYKVYQSELLMREAGNALQAKITKGLAEGKTFQAICAEEKLEVAAIPPFASSTRTLPEVEQRTSFPLYREIALDTPTGQISRFVPTGNSGFLLHVKERQPVSDEKVKAELASHLESLREARQNQAFSEWFRKEVQKALPAAALQ